MELPFICPKCAKASWNREDLKRGWCNACKEGWLDRTLQGAIRHQCDHDWAPELERFAGKIFAFRRCRKCGITEYYFGD